ncbi:MAG: hypothetical protein JNN07_03150 [Verrucomicrobiales bacterium]|nr:hypothetical protein [Verrucomicrobiales bacterium]
MNTRLPKANPESTDSWSLGKQGHPIMKNILALAFQVVIVLIGIGALTFLLREPHVEGRNAHATTFQIIRSLLPNRSHENEASAED